jgi:hypothetical protein
VCGSIRPVNFHYRRGRGGPPSPARLLPALARTCRPALRQECQKRRLSVRAGRHRQDQKDVTRYRPLEVLRVDAMNCKCAGRRNASNQSEADGCAIIAPTRSHPIQLWAWLSPPLRRPQQPRHPVSRSPVGRGLGTCPMRACELRTASAYWSTNSIKALPGSPRSSPGRLAARPTRYVRPARASRR